jgi:sulfoxide reductase catalytic subunit YedY
LFVIRKRGWEIPERLATPESVYLNRRELIGSSFALLAGSAVAGVPTSALAQTDQTVDLYPAARNSRYTVNRTVTPEAVNTNYNSFYEFGSQKDVARAATALRRRQRDVHIDGLVEREFTLSIDDLIRRMTLEERLYRHRAVDGWSMTVPWTGFPLSALLALAKPLSSAAYLRMETFLDPEMASGQKNFSPWPYVEGLTMAEAANELAFLVTGAYGKLVANVMGAPLRLHVPWKYGFKSIKSIVRFSFTDEQPLGFWQQVQPNEYGFWANVNPDVPHARWSQAMERDIATDQMIPTQIFNGYGEYVAAMYSGLGGQPLYT